MVDESPVKIVIFLIVMWQFTRGYVHQLVTSMCSKMGHEQPIRVVVSFNNCSYEFYDLMDCSDLLCLFFLRWQNRHELFIELTNM